MLEEGESTKCTNSVICELLIELHGCSMTLPPMKPYKCNTREWLRKKAKWNNDKKTIKDL